MTPYQILLLAALFGGGFTLWRMGKTGGGPLLTVYLITIAGAFLGAKIIYLLAEGWLYRGHPDQWRIWATGKSVLGALLFGYVFAEWGKRQLSYRRTTGDMFALTVPAGLVFGRAGCWLQGCCGGKECAAAWWTLTDATGGSRWPAAPVELLFNLVCLPAFLTLHRVSVVRGQLFHVYLIAYGIFRFLHEFVRDTPRICGPFSGYHFAALAVALLGLLCFRRRQRETRSAGLTSVGAPCSGE